MEHEERRPTGTEASAPRVRPQGKLVQMVERSVEVVSFFRNSLTVVAEQVIEVPKLALPDGFLLRTFRLEPQMAEQLVEVPTVLSPALLQHQVAEQIVDNPVPRGRGARGGLPGCPPGQVSQLNVGQLVDIPVPGEGPDFGDLPGFHPGQGSTARRGAVSSTARRGGGAQGSVPGNSVSWTPVCWTGLVVPGADGRDGWIESPSSTLAATCASRRHAGALRRWS